MNINRAKRYVGGINTFEEAGRKQFEFLVAEGLRPNHELLDVGCGNCRAGRLFIAYLEPEHYVGLEHHQWLIDAAKEDERINIINKKGEKLFDVQKPHFIINDNFDLFTIYAYQMFDYIIAKSVFTHLTKERIEQCCKVMKEYIKPDSKFYASISVGDSRDNPKVDHDNKRFRYSIKEIEDLANGWNVESLGRVGTFKQTMLRLIIK